MDQPSAGESRVIEQADKQLKEWVAEVLDGVDASFGPPSDSRSGRGVSLYLIDLVEKPPPRTTKRPPLQLSLRYLVTTWATEPEDAHRLLGKLVFDAMARPEFDVELDPLAPSVWAALQCAPRGSFVLRVPLRKDQPEIPVKPVLRPLRVQSSQIASLSGVVLGPGDEPVVRARVELPALEISTQTDLNGRFEFPFVPSDPPIRRLMVRAKGRQISVSGDAVTKSRPLVIRFDPWEG
jgi:hypothetical protein